MSNKTEDKRSQNLLPGQGPKFTSKNQPTPEQKSAGWAKKKALKELLNLCISGNDPVSTKARESLAQILGVKASALKKMTFEEVMDLRQIQRAFNDTRAWKAIKDTVYGQKHDIEHSGHIVTANLTSEQIKEIAKALENEY